jgi:serine/threonine-protein kinase
MPRSPSPELARWLLDHQLCSPRDFIRCGKRVAKLVEDLPPFDFVWLDALVQLGRLSPYQAHLLESPAPDQLLLGPCLLVHPCSSGKGNQTWQARHSQTGARVAVKLINGPFNECEPSAGSWQRLTKSLRGLRNPGICGPMETLPTPRGLVLMSPWVDGPHLRDVLVRKGRFPPAVVAAMGWQLLTSLEHLESLGLPHGDLRLENVRLTPGGQIVLVDTGVRSILEPEQTVHSGMHPDHFEGIAPERIGTAQPATPAAELYALGCLLWHLLVGRPPFPAGDPVVKLSRHQSCDVDDVREHAPETPASLAELLLGMTRRDPSQRPAGAAAALRQWPRPLPDAQRLLKTFLQQVEQPAALPRGRQTHRRLSLAIWGTLGLAVFAGAGFLASRAELETALRGTLQERTENSPAELAGGGSGDAALAEAAAISRSAADGDEAARSPEDGTTTPGNQLRLASHVAREGKSAARSRTVRALPAPDAAGVLSLVGDQVYELRDITVVGGLVIQGEEERPAQIRITVPGEITAQSIVIRNVIFEIAAGGLTEPGETGAALTLRTQRAELVSVGCLGTDFTHANAERSALVRWELVDERDVRNSNLRLSHCVFRQGGAAVVVPQAVARVEVRESLFEGGEVAVELAGSAKRSIPLVMRWNHVTTRGLQNVIRWWGDEGPPGGIRLEWELQDSVLHLSDRDGALVQLLSARYTNEWIPRLAIGGAGNLLAPEQTIVRWQSDSFGESLEIDSPELEVEGLMSVPFEFAAERGAALQPLGRIPGVALRRTRPPGCEPARLPGEAAGSAEPSAP